MKIKLLIGSLLATFAAVSLQQASAQPVSLTGSSYTNTFDNLEANTGLPGEWITYTGASATAAGTIYSWAPVNYTASSNSWRSTTGRFANQASTFSYVGGTNFIGTETNNPIQWTEPNRCLALRQTGSLGDPGGAFVLKLADTVDRKDFVLSVDFLNLDPTSPRTTRWTVDFGLGATPSFFVPLATWVNTPSNFTTYHTNIVLANGTIDNDPGPVWIRIVALSASTGSGNRETSAIDNFGLTWAAGSSCTPVSIVTSPANATAYINGNQSFTVGALGTKPISYVWLKNGTNLLTDDGHFSGTATPTLTIIKVQPEDAGTYSCTVANVCDGTPHLGADQFQLALSGYGHHYHVYQYHNRQHGFLLSPGQHRRNQSVLHLRLDFSSEHR
ncbi:MAG: immunoglobulin domain-containing protein [Verrucomicrobia bacterium]|nr:immunoglobulin domain-containing protein [Verrucomicrobiota bacterium]